MVLFYAIVLWWYCIVCYCKVCASRGRHDAHLASPRPNPPIAANQQIRAQPCHAAKEEGKGEGRPCHAANQWIRARPCVTPSCSAALYAANVLLIQSFFAVLHCTTPHLVGTLEPTGENQWEDGGEGYGFGSTHAVVDAALQPFASSVPLASAWKEDMT